MSLEEMDEIVLEKIELIDDKLAHMEDYTHGEDGVIITECRKLIVEIQELLK